MADLNETSLEAALVSILKDRSQKPRHLVVTEEGLATQGMRMAAGELTEDDLRSANIPDDVIAETKIAALSLLLANLIEQIEMSDFRDGHGHPLKNNVHYVAAKEAVSIPSHSKPTASR